LNAGENFKPLMTLLESLGFLAVINASMPKDLWIVSIRRWSVWETRNTWEIGVTTGLVSLFKQNKKSSDLINSDFLEGLTAPHGNSKVSYRALRL
jgi:hypothetical protein